jgi:hypothetical protein
MYLEEPNQCWLGVPVVVAAAIATAIARQTLAGGGRRKAMKRRGWRGGDEAEKWRVGRG